MDSVKSGPAPCRAQLIPHSSASDPPQDTAKLICQVSGIYLILMTQTPENKEGRRCSRCWRRDSPAAHKESVHGAGIPCSPWRGQCQNQVTFPEGTAACGRPTLVYPEVLQPAERTDAGEREMCVVEGAAERSFYIPIPSPHPPITHTPALLGMWVGEWRAGKERVRLNLGRRVCVEETSF